MIASIKTLKFILATVYQINKKSAFKETFFTLMTSSRKKRQHDYRLIDSCFHKKLEIHVSSSLSNKQKKSAFTQKSYLL